MRPRLLQRLLDRIAAAPGDRVRAGSRRALPSQCRVCHAWPSQTLCLHCVASFAPVTPRCERCALPVAGGVRVCGACLRTPPPLDQCLTALPYAWPWAAVVSQFKFHGEPGLAAPLAQLLRAAPGVAQALANADLIVPLPLSAERLAERGYNPAQLLAQHAAPRAAPIRLDLLLRTRHRLAQHELPRAQRLRNVRGAYAVDPLQAAALAQRRVLLVDDVMTTGASLYEAARAVRSAGAAHIAAVVLARTAEH